MKTLWDTPDIPRCRRCHKRLTFDADGELAARGVCWNCDTRGLFTSSGRLSDAEIARRIAAVNAQHREAAGG